MSHLTFISLSVISTGVLAVEHGLVVLHFGVEHGRAHDKHGHAHRYDSIPRNVTGHKIHLFTLPIHSNFTQRLQFIISHG